MYAQHPFGPTSSGLYQAQRKKQMRATQVRSRVPQVGLGLGSS